MQRSLLLLATALVVQGPSAASARKLQVTTDDRDSQSFPWDLPEGLSQSPDLPLDEEPLARTVSGFQPEGVHLTQWTTDSVLVSWQTGEPLLGGAASPAPPPHDPAAVPSVVRWGTKRGELKQRTEGDAGVVYTYTYGQDHGNATYHSPILHHVILSGLRPGTPYFYSVGCEEHGWSEVLAFSTLRPAFPLRLGFVGDVGQTANSSATLAKLTSSKPDAVVVVGDFTYADDHPPAGGTPHWGTMFATEQRRWDAWARLTQPLLARLPLVSCRGNHEIEQLLEAQNATSTAANARYPYPQDPARIATQPNIGAWFLDQQGTAVAGGAHGQARFKNESSFDSLGYYSLDLAPGVHIVSLNSYLPWGRESQQYRWLQADLAAVDRQKTPWLIVLFHAAGYHSYAGHYKEADTFMALLEPLFYRYQVDLVYSGHVHAYERTFPVYRYRRDDCGPVYTLIGDGGNVEGLYKDFIDAQPQPAFCADSALYQLPVYQPISGKDPVITLQDGYFCPNRQPDWSAYREPTFGHGVLEIQNATHAAWEWHRTLDSGAEGGVDRVTISKTPEGACAAAALRADADVMSGGTRRGLDATALRGRPSLLTSLHRLLSAVYTWL
ncbi:purple acid phosphatase 15 isoform X2 [Micractinium conductrix]|uniref:Purple acid phosphatase n=1 Tax=Micractinium conductrix TaxID=554055 RepID=A0A2P6VS99_9CHLO|nr:purple acid phosphatase 15 isoform X2 [Micractinium conductrix]|eukprot:PSC76955.1 purple acid phosphatase 15 isoform X2 [Micractinium conductrix]